ncbi:hypothetical protein JRO89_XS04G0043600 [Xanthoceras sorbifolium]|uniref:F-box domain-containing protein n=1 Tax=Xanthoceras sorbifolium TaxID=99658 RepID=A0ABQ8I440_9ROSI|nr:hypothetical protein JRO89_XS04G0043600 [Xanthoceras sorbifolium]
MAMDAGMLSLPEDCIAAVISFTTPRDICRLSSVSSLFKSAAESDVVWDRFLTPEYLSVISGCGSSSLSMWSSKKELYLRACHNPVLIDEGKLSFWLDKRSGKKCYMISTRACKIEWGDTTIYWNWISLPEARFPEVAKLIDVCLFDIEGKINTSLLSPRTTYVAYLVFKPTGEEYGFEDCPIDATVGFVGSEGRKQTIYLDTDRGLIPWDAWEQVDHVPWHAGLFNPGEPITPSVPEEEEEEEEEEDHVFYVPSVRGDGWLETELGKFFYQGHEDGELEIIVMENLRLHWKSGLIFQGIEIRPKRSR